MNFAWETTPAKSHKSPRLKAQLLRELFYVIDYINEFWRARRDSNSRPPGS